MTRFLFLSLLTIISFSLNAQNVKVTGKLEVTSMDTLNSEDLLVVRKGDGTLGTRQVSSLPLPTDTARSLATDLALAKLLCDCGNNMPPFLVESVLNAGYTETDLLNANVPLGNLINGGASLQGLLNAGIAPVDLIAEGASINDFYGLNYAGGLIFYITPSGIGLVCAETDLSSSSVWGCESTDLPNVDNVSINPPSGPGADIGEGLINTNNIVSNGCILSSDAAFICYDLDQNGYDDWVLPSILELEAMYNNLFLQGNGNFYEPTYFSSTERATNVVWAFEFNTGSLIDNYGKATPLAIRPIRPF